MARGFRALFERIENGVFARPSVSNTPGFQAAANATKFEQRPPSAQNEIDIFAGRWASDLSDLIPGTHAGPAKHFTADPRPRYAMEAFAHEAAGRRLRVLELGPLEGGHTYQFERMGVEEIVAVEANVEAFLKCLIVKNRVGLHKARFLLGDAVEYLKADTSRYDFIFCCGILYHMRDPLALIELMAARTDRIFVWTHYHTVQSRPGLPQETVQRGGEAYTYHQLVYRDREIGTFWGGNKPAASFMARDDILRAFAQQGFANVRIHDEDLSHPGGPCFSVSLWR
jgi:uncharacterized protein DUF1698